MEGFWSTKVGGFYLVNHAGSWSGGIVFADSGRSVWDLEDNKQLLCSVYRPVSHRDGVFLRSEGKETGFWGGILSYAVASCSQGYASLLKR